MNLPDSLVLFNGSGAGVGQLRRIRGGAKALKIVSAAMKDKVPQTICTASD